MMVLSEFPNVIISGDNLDLSAIEDALLFICDQRNYKYEAVKVEIIFATDFELTNSGYNKRYVKNSSPNGEYIPIINQTEVAARDNIDRIIINQGKLFSQPFKYLCAVIIHELNHCFDWKKAEQIYIKNGVDLTAEPIEGDEESCRKYFWFHAYSESNSKYYEDLYIWDEVKGDYLKRISDSLPQKTNQDYYLMLMYVVGMLRCLTQHNGEFEQIEINTLLLKIKSEYKEIEKLNMEEAFDWNNVCSLCGLDR